MRTKKTLNTEFYIFQEHFPLITGFLLCDMHGNPERLEIQLCSYPICVKK